MTAAEARAAGERIRLLSPDRRQKLCAMLANLVASADPVPDVAPFELVCEADRAKLPPDAVDAYPLGQVQLGMIFEMRSDKRASRTSGVPAAYHNVATSHFRIANYCENAFRESVQLLTERHENFRTSFHMLGFSEPLAIVHRSCPAKVEIFDLRGKSSEEQREEFAEFESAQNASVVDLCNAPLIGINLHVFSDHDIKLTLVEPHPISDGWSTHLTLVELISNYSFLLSEAQLPQSPSPLSYRQFIAEERAAIASDAQRLFWQTFLAGSSNTELPSRPVATPPCARQKSYHELDRALGQEILRLAREQGYPIRTVLLAAHFKALALFSGSQDIVTGVDFNSRLERIGGTELRGMFLNSLPMRLESLGITWADLLASVHTADCLMLPFRRYPLAEVLRVVGSQVRPSTLFGFHHFHSVRQVRDAGIVDSMENVTDESRTSVPFGVVFNRSAEREDTFTMFVDTDPALFTPDYVQSFVQTYMDALRQMSRNIEAPHTSMSRTY